MEQSLVGSKWVSGNLVFYRTDTGVAFLTLAPTGATLVTPSLGAATVTSVNKVVVTAPATAATLTIVDGKTFKCSKTIEITSPDDTSVATLPAGAKTLAASDASNLVLANAQIFVGSAGNIATAVAMSGDVAIVAAGTTTIQANAVTRAKMSAAARAIQLTGKLPTVPASATPARSVYIVMPWAGTISAISSIPSETLAANDTNYLTFTATNLTGSKVLLKAGDASNQTTATGGTAWTVDTQKNHVLTVTGGDLAVAAGDIVKFTATGTGTPANAVNSAGVFISVTATA